MIDEPGWFMGLRGNFGGRLGMRIYEMFSLQQIDDCALRITDSLYHAPFLQEKVYFAVVIASLQLTAHRLNRANQ